MIIKKEAEGYNQPLKMKVPVEIRDNRIFLPNYFEYPYEYRFRDYRLDYELVVPSRMIVINEKEYEISMRGDDEKDQENHDGTLQIEKNKISINGSTIEYSSDDKDSIIIDGVKVPQHDAKKKIDSIKNIIKLKENEIKNIEIKDGDSKISIKTK
jgi:hypothetical protein